MDFNRTATESNQLWMFQLCLDIERGYRYNDVNDRKVFATLKGAEPSVACYTTAFRDYMG